MTVKEMAEKIEGARVVCGKENMQRSEGVEVDFLSADSRLCERGSAFFCLQGGNCDGHDFLSEAIENGAVVCICEREQEVEIPQIVVPNTRVAMSVLASYFYPIKHLKIIGITGTNGKTTTSFMLSSILKEAGKKVGTIGTLGIWYEKKVIAPDLTTPDPIFLHQVLHDMEGRGVEYAVMEVSAHAIYHHKVDSIPFTACIFTNFSQDHLDFFHTMDEYKKAKKGLFVNDKCPLAILNGDDYVGREIGKMRWEKRQGRTYYYGLNSPAEGFAIPTREGLLGSECMLNIEDELCRISLLMAGTFNIYNALASAVCARSLGIPMDAIEKGLCIQVKGRMQWIASFKGGEIFVDFAHTPKGLECVMKELKKHAKGRLIALFGCGGNRDKEKRKMMGEISGKYADFTVLTSDNPRYEEPIQIIKDIEVGVRRFSEAYAVIPQRKEAIFYALGELNKGDILLVAGKGGEDTQEIMGIKYAYNDESTIKEMIGNYIK